MEHIEISVVIPIFNEAKGLETLVKKLRDALLKLGKSFEIIFIDDGSTDGTRELLRALPVRAIFLNRNHGQFTAMATGIRKVRGKIVVTMDGDLENDPADVEKLLKKLSEGFDVVSGWRRDRWKGEFLTRRIPSLSANAFISWVTGVKLHDYGCNMKVYRKEILDRLQLAIYMQRMIPAYAAREGAKVAEVAVSFTPRPYGRSNYGLLRTFRVFFDVLTFHFFYKYGSRPMHFFGTVGLWSFIFGLLVFLYMVFLKFFRHTDFIKTPLPVLSAMFVIVGILFVLMGLLAELIIRHTPKEAEHYEEVGK